MKIIMDSQMKSIAKVQEAEGKAQLIIDEAKKQKEKKLHDAAEKAHNIADEAADAANALGEDILKNAEHELAELRKKKLEETHRTSSKLKKVKLSKQKLEKLADEFVKEIMGA